MLTLKSKHSLAGALACVVLLAGAQAAHADKKGGLVEEFSGQGYGMAGCGLGSILFGEKPGMIQIFSSTTNGIYSNNTFGVSSGTSNCEPEGDGGKAAQVFIESNRYSMQNDIARGQGETLQAFMVVAGCDHAQAVVGQTLHQNYAQIYRAGATDLEVYNSIRHTLGQNRATAQSCQNLGSNSVATN